MASFVLHPQDWLCYSWSFKFPYKFLRQLVDFSEKAKGIFFFFRIFFFFYIFFFIYLWLCWVFVSVRGLSLAAASGGHSSSLCAGLSLSRPLLLRSTGSRRAGSVAVAHGPSCSVACGIFPDQGSNPCPLHWQADSQPLRHQGSPAKDILINIKCCPLAMAYDWVIGFESWTTEEALTLAKAKF